MKSKIGIGITICCIILVAILLVVFTYPTKTETNETLGTVTNIEKKQENIVAQNVQEDTNVQTNQEVEENIIEENNTIVPTETFEESPKTEEEKALDIAKKDYGENSNVKFGVEGMTSDGKYIVSVRDTSTTEAMVYYTIDVTSGTFTKREMN